MAAYYNENDAKIAAWLRELISAGVIAPGVVDERDIRDVRPSELAGYAQCHFFAGIGVWSYALRLAGWPDDRPVWTGSCPCQPFSTAGKGTGFTDERHLWPSWFHLIQQCRPDALFGEQVSDGDGLAWFDVVRADLESSAYSVGGADLCAPGVGAPNIRQRICFVADTHGHRCYPSSKHRSDHEEHYPESRGEPRSMAHTNVEGLAKQHQRWDGANQRTVGTSGLVGGFWADSDWINCRDGKARPIEPGTFPLVNGTTTRILRLRGYGNAVNAEVAAAWIGAYMSVRV